MQYDFVFTAELGNNHYHSRFGCRCNPYNYKAG